MFLSFHWQNGCCIPTTNDSDHAIKLKLSSRPASVDALIKIIIEQLRKYNLTLNYFTKMKTLTGNSRPFQTSRNCHKELFCTSLFYSTQVLLLYLLYSWMCHLQSAWAGGLQAPFQSQHLLSILNWNIRMEMQNMKRYPTPEADKRPKAWHIRKHFIYHVWF